MFARSIIVQATDSAFAPRRSKLQNIAGKALLAVAATMFVSSFAMASQPAVSGIAAARGVGYTSQQVAAPEALVAAIPLNAKERLLFWNKVAIDATGLDHTPLVAGETRVFGEQFGPHRSSRAMAIIHIAMYDAVNTIIGGYKPFSATFTTPAGTSVDAAIAQAAHDALVGMYPSQKPALDAKLATDLSYIFTVLPSQKANGIHLGKVTAAAILALRANDGANKRPEPVIGVDYFTGTGPGAWTQDPVSQVPLALGAWWGEDVKPFVNASASQFRLPVPPALTSAVNTAAFNQVQVLGGDGVATPTIRTADQTIIGTFWAYDAAPSLCAPPRLYNQVVTQIAAQRGTTNVADLARLLALTNTAMADGALTAWDSKFFYKRWRPIGGQRIDDGNPNTITDPTFSPLGSPSSNLTGPNFTPPFPAYPSGHATIGGALFQSLRNFYGTDTMNFTLGSDEYNGITKDNTGKVRPVVKRSYTKLSQAEYENGISRIYLGVHYLHDYVYGDAAGISGANYLFGRAFTRLP